MNIYKRMFYPLKVPVELHEGEKSTKKIWRLNADLAAEYTKIQLEKEIECLFPLIQKKNTAYVRLDRVRG